MATQNTIPKNTLIIFLFTLAVIAETAFSQDCMDNGGCPDVKDCCSMWGYCGTTEEHCGFWCFSGACKPITHPSRFGLNAGPRGKIEAVITPSLFNKMISKVGSNCTGNGFYTYKAFITAVKSFGNYKGTIAKREIAAILVQFSYGSESFCNKEEIAKETFCTSSKKYPCEPGKKYYGRGPLQSIKSNLNYGAAGKYLRLPLLKDPDMVARSPEVAFKFAMWFWETKVRVVRSGGFGASTTVLNELDCVGLNRVPVQEKRVNQYLELCKLLGVNPGIGLYC